MHVDYEALAFIAVFVVLIIISIACAVHLETGE